MLRFDDETMTAVTTLTAALLRVADNQDRLIAGQAAALEKIDGAKPATTRGRKKADEAPVAAPAEAETPEPAPTETKSFLPDLPTDEASMKAYVGTWTGAVEGDARAKRVQLLKDMATHFGVGPQFAALAALGAEKVKQIVFYIERHKTGATVDFNADYDFDGDPKQGGATPAAADDSDFG